MGRIVCTIAALIAVGCSVDASPSGTSFRCGSEGRCPAGMECVDGICSAAGPVESDAAVESSLRLSLVVAATGEELEDFVGQTIRLNRWDLENGGFSIRAQIDDDRVDAVEFRTAIGVTRRSIVPPHHLTESLEGSGLDPYPYTFGEDELTVRALAGEEVLAEVSYPLAVKLDDIEPAIRRVAFVATATGLELELLGSGTEVSLSDLPLQFNIQLDPLPSVVRKIEVELSPAPSSWTPTEQADGGRSDVYAPYFVGGDSLEDELQLEAGSYMLRVTVYHPDGSVQFTSEIDFTVVP